MTCPGRSANVSPTFSLLFAGAHGIRPPLLIPATSCVIVCIHVNPRDFDMSTRILAFLRDLLPAQKSHFLFLFGLFLLLEASSSSWLPGGMMEEQAFGGDGWQLLGYQISHPEIQRMFTFLRGLLLVTASVAALPLVFLRVERAPQKLLAWVLLPGFLAIVQFAAQMYLRDTPKPIPTQVPLIPLPEPPLNWFDFVLNSPGLVTALLALALLVIATWRVHTGLTTLPILFRPHSMGHESSDAQTSTRILLFLAASLLYPLLTDPLLIFLWQWLQRASPFVFRTELMWLFVLLDIPFRLIYLLFMMWLLGGTGRELRNVFRPGRLIGYGFAVGIIMFAVAVPRFLLYLWLEFQAYLGPPDYPIWQLDRAWLVESGSFWQIWLPHLIPYLLITEVLYRGLLQSRLVRQFGFRRGLLLLILIAVAVDRSTIVFPTIVVYSKLLSLAVTALLTVLLGWLFERSGTIWPVFLVHLAFRMSLLSFGGAPSLSRFRELEILEILFLALAAFWLFRRFPPRPPLPEPAPVLVPVPSPPPQSFRLPPPRSDQ